MIDFKVLGALELQAPDGSAVASILTGPKKVAVLAFLALEAGGAFQRRDTLLGLFWPESDQERARASLRNLVHALRRGLGPDVLLARGDEELGLAPAALTCDALRFQEACAAGAWSDALAEYRGELLPGFFLADSPAFENWLDGQRQRLRRLAVEGTCRLAEAAGGRHDPAAAVAWARRCVELAGPGDEAAARLLIASLDAAGDRAGAIRAHDDLERWLRAEHEVEPSPETRRLIDAVRSRAEARPVPVDVAAVAPPPPDPVEAALESPPPAPAPAPLIPGARGRGFGGARPPRPGRGRRLRWLAGLLLLAVAVAGAGWSALRRAPAMARGRVAILPFSVEGGQRELAQGMVQLLSARFEGSGALKAVDPYALLSYLGKESGPADPAAAEVVADRFGAQLYLLGSVVAMGGRYQISAALYDRRRGGEAVARAHVTSDEPGFLGAVDRLAGELLAARAGSSNALGRNALQATSSFSALSAYFAGEEDFRDGRFESAIAHLRRALAEDSLFALAHYRLAVAAEWADQLPLSLQAADRAAALSARLPRHERLLLRAYQGFARRDIAQASTLVDSLLTDDPDDLEATFQRAELRFHFGQLSGTAQQSSRPDFERVLTLAPLHRPALVHVARLAAARGDSVALDSLVARFLAAESSGDRALEMRALRAFAGGWTVEASPVLAELRAAPPLSIRVASQALALFACDAVSAERVASVLAEPGRPAGEWAEGMVTLAGLELARGRWGGAEVHLGQVQAALGLDPVRVTQAKLAGYLLPVISQAERQRIRRTLAAAPVAGDPPAYVRTYYEGLLAAGAGDALGVKAALARLEAEDSARAAARAVALVVRAADELARREPAAALKTAQAVNLELADLQTALWTAGVSAQARFIRAEALFQLGRMPEALAWYRTLPSGVSDLPYLAPSTLRQAQILDRLGQRREARRLYLRFVALWRNADAAVQPQVRAALSRVAALDRS